jgi:hypothetical protein
MTSVFLSYARGHDVEPFDPATSFVARLYCDLRAAGFGVWFDRQDMPARNLTFHQEIRDAIAARERLLLVVGPKTVTSDYVRQEWQFALREADKVVTPILRLGGLSARSRRVEAAPLRGFPQRLPVPFPSRQPACGPRSRGLA